MSNAYDKIAATILASMDEAGKWIPPWHRSGLIQPKNAISGRHYEGVNVLTCWVNAQICGYEAQLWATYQQWSEAGAQVRKGEKATPIVFWSKRPSRENKDKEVWIVRNFSIFNRAQVDNPPPLPDQPPELPEETRIAGAEEFIARIAEHATIKELDGVGPHYRPLSDEVFMPPFRRFKSAEGFYATLLHELSHWTGHGSREGRQFGKRFGDDAYALEELVAELSAVFLACDLGIEAEPRSDHASYIAHWHRLLKEKPDAFATAVASARKAAAFLHATAEREVQLAA